MQAGLVALVLGAAAVSLTATALLIGGTADKCQPDSQAVFMQSHRLDDELELFSSLRGGGNLLVIQTVLGQAGEPVALADNANVESSEVANRALGELPTLVGYDADKFYWIVFAFDDVVSPSELDRLCQLVGAEFNSAPSYVGPPGCSDTSTNTYLAYTSGQKKEVVRECGAGEPAFVEVLEFHDKLVERAASPSLRSSN